MKIAFVTPGMNFRRNRKGVSILANNWYDMVHEVSLFITASKQTLCL